MASTIKLKNGSGAPTTGDLVQGEPALDLTNKRLYTENASGVVIEVGTNPSTIDINAGTIDGTVIGGSTAAAITGTTITGTSFVSSGDMTFGDNDKAIFGAGSDLQIYHDGSNSYIKDVGTGFLVVNTGTTGFLLQNGSGQNVIQTGGNDVTLRYGASTKLTTTTTGIDVTGTATMDGLTVSKASGDIATLENTTVAGDVQANLLFNPVYDVNARIVSAREGAALASTLSFETGVDNTGNTVKRQHIASNGDISFYEDTGTTAKLFWDASAESLTLSGSGAGSLTLDRGTSGNQIKFANAGTTLGYFGYIDGTGFSITGSDGGSDVVVDSAGNVGIGAADAASYGKFLVTGTGNLINANASSGAATFQLYEAGAGRFGITTLNGSAGAKFTTAGTERMRIDSAGNLLVGKTSTSGGIVGSVIASSGLVRLTADGIAVAEINRLTSDGSIVDFKKNGTTVGSIGTVVSQIYIGTGDTCIRFRDEEDRIIPTDGSGAARDDIIDLGRSSARFDDIYASNGTIQTSDRNEKQDIEVLSDAEQRVAVACKGLLRKFRWKSKVEEKGDDARIHFGIIAQDLQAAFEAEGLDAGRYAMFISSTWTDEETGEERSRMGVRYSELLAFIIAAI